MDAIEWTDLLEGCLQDLDMNTRELGRSASEILHSKSKNQKTVERLLTIAAGQLARLLAFARESIGVASDAPAGQPIEGVDVIAQIEQMAAAITCSGQALCKAGDRRYVAVFMDMASHALEPIELINAFARSDAQEMILGEYGCKQLHIEGIMAHMRGKGAAGWNDQPQWKRTLLETLLSGRHRPVSYFMKKMKNINVREHSVRRALEDLHTYLSGSGYRLSTRSSSVGATYAMKREITRPVQSDFRVIAEEQPPAPPSSPDASAD